MQSLGSRIDADPQSALSYARVALRRASTRAEVLLSSLRGVFCALIGIRFAWIHLHESIPNAFDRGSIFFIAIIAGVVYSVRVVRRFGRAEMITDGALTTSVLIDASLCALALSSNVIQPWPEYRGVLLLPDTMTFLVLILSSGFRVSPRLVLIGTITNAAALSCLVALDHHLNGAQVAYGFNEGSFYITLIACIAGLSWLSAQRTEQLVESAAQYGHKAVRAKHGLSRLLKEHHDAMTHLSAVLFDADNLASCGQRGLDLAALQDDLAILEQALRGIKERALGESTALSDASYVDINKLIDEEASHYERVVAPMQIRWQVEGELPRIKLEGGAMTMRRLILNLLANAAEGDGVEGASRADVVMHAHGDWLRLSVFDDGPGMPAGAVAATRKPRGTGHGLTFARSVVTAAGGRVEIEPTDGRGTHACLLFPIPPSVLRHAALGTAAAEPYAGQEP